MAGKRKAAQYSAAEKKAFHMGRAYAAGKANKRVKCKTEKEKASFRNGVNAVRAKKSGDKVKRRNGVRCENCGYIVDADGVIVKVKM